MKTKFTNVLTCVLFSLFVFGMLGSFLLLPHNNYSELEKRYLTEMPKLTWETLLSGEFGEKAETYIADHITGRDFLVGLSSYYDLLTNRQVTKDVYVAEGDRLVEAPAKENVVAVTKNMNTINAFADAIGKPVDLLLVPSAGYILQDSIQGLKDPYLDDKIIQSAYAMAGENVQGRDVLSVFSQAQNKDDLYYRMDHHWTSLGAYTAYRAYMEMLGRQPLARTDFTVESHRGFYGSNYSRSGLWLYPPEEIELWETGASFVVTNGESEEIHNGLFYENRLEELDKYTVFLDGNHSLVRIENPDAKGKGKLLVIRDSYTNCLGTFLANDYESVVLVDLRYYKKPVSELLQNEDFSNVLVCYSIGNFLTDTNILWLR